MATSRTEQEPQLVVRFGRHSGDLEVESEGKTFKTNLGRMPRIGGRIPFVGEEPTRQLSKEDGAYLDSYERVAGKELAIRVNVVGTSEDEWPAGNAKSSHGSVMLVQEEAIAEGNFRTATEFMLDRGFEAWRLQHRVHLSGTSLQNKLSTRREKLEVRTQEETMKDEIAEINDLRKNQT